MNGAAGLQAAERAALVVEDSTTQRLHMVALMHQLGFHPVHQAHDGADALRVLEALAPRPVELLVTDIDMPGMDGIALIARLAQQRQVRQLVVTSARDPRLLETVGSVGVDNPHLQLLGVLPKPVTRDQLDRLLARQAGAPQACAKQPPAPGPDITLADIERALEAHEFVPFVQPKVALASGRLAGVEALARWQHPQHGLLGPQHFIPLLEGSPLMPRFTLAMVAGALDGLRQWRRAMPALQLSLNLSADDLADAAFIELLTALVQRHGVAPASLTWEVTETVLMGKPSLANLARLALQGFGLSMDDYGTGYSSMQTLSRSPFSELKIDRVFVDGASDWPNRRTILDSSLDLARRLGLSTVAEGVETLADWHLLRELRCDLAQGYFIARPMPGGELLGWVKANRARLRALACGSAGPTVQPSIAAAPPAATVCHR
jgi:EAL domain-containing protein (putative c-di-GMP-specific phosphodiesterase class I)/ActR/RegA family two-component response regulator